MTPLTLCRKHHRLVHRNGRVRAQAEGFIVSQAVDVPANIGVMRFAEADGGTTQYPSCTGKWLDAPELLEAA